VPKFRPYEKEEEKEEDGEGNEDRERRGPPLVSPLYFYHPDHLGTSTYVSDANGMPYQFFLNLPLARRWPSSTALHRTMERHTSSMRRSWMLRRGIITMGQGIMTQGRVSF
jgi:hypothetical protein